MSIDNKDQELSFGQQQEITGILEAYRSNPSNSNKYRHDLFAYVDRRIRQETIKAQIAEIGRFSEWYYFDRCDGKKQPIENYKDDRIATLEAELKEIERGTS